LICNTNVDIALELQIYLAVVICVVMGLILQLVVFRYITHHKINS